ncbi:dynamin family protein [Kineosporia babensis]|uniref:Dynamin family protein n=1 Tax=Kineosporia babensis TaxID=499548 RepID=A0A9X1NBL3_9ACTN|nr:dynamin family protein [Kineosporia babensis]MCD5310710.1 dynamin family protein [Kineosporia babensis]
MAPDTLSPAARNVLDVIAAAGGVHGLTQDDRWDDVQTMAGKLRDRFFLVAVCGEFSSGKSTLLGAVLGRPELFPADVGPTTSVPTVVRWAEREQIAVVTLERPEGFAITAPELTGYVTEAGNPGNQRQVTEVRVGLPDALLAAGIGFVDLPGIGSTNPRHAVITNAYLEHIDAALFVSGGPVSESEMTFLQRVGERIGTELVLARAQADKPAIQFGQAGVDRAVDNLREKSADALGVARESLTVLPVSAKLFQTAADEDDEVASGIPVLRQTLRTGVAVRAENLLAVGALNALDASVAATQERYRVRMIALEQGQTPEILAVRADLAERDAQLQQVTATEKTWRSHLDSALRSVATDQLTALNSGIHRLSALAQAEIDGAKAVSLDANRFTSNLINQVHDLYTRAAGGLEESANAIVTELANDLGVPLERIAARSAFGGTQAGAFQEPEKRKFESTVQRYAEAGTQAARKAGFARMIGAFGGMGLAAMIAAPFTGGASLLVYAIGGAVAGANAATAVGTAVNMQSELAALDRIDPEQRRSRLRQHVRQALAPNTEEAKKRLEDVVRQLQVQAFATVDGAVESAKREVRLRIKEISEDLQRTQDEATAELARLRSEEREIVGAVQQSARARAALHTSDD